MQPSETSPDEFISGLPDGVRDDIETLDRLITDAMPGATRTLWEGVFWGGTEQSIIGYGDYQYERSGKDIVQWFVVGLAAQKNHLSLYVNAADDTGYLVARYGGKLGRAKVGSAVVSFKSVSDLQLDAVRELVAEAHRLSS